MATSSSRPPSKSYDLELTIVSAKHLKNVNWRNGYLKPYVIFWVEPDLRLATKSDDSGSTRPVWNERFVLPLTLPPQDSLLTLEILHSKPSETPKPLVGTLRVQLSDLVDSDESTRVRAFELRRPSGRPHGKVYLKLALCEGPELNYQIAPSPSYYYSIAPPPPPPSAARDYRGYNPSLSFTAHPPPPPQMVVPPPPPPHASSSPPPPPPTHSYQYGGYTDSYSSYYPRYYSQQQQQPPPPSRPFFERQPSYSGPGPSAPVDYTPPDQKRGSIGLGAGLAVGAVAGTLGGLALEEGIKYEEEKIAEKVENQMAARDSYGDYRVDY